MERFPEALDGIPDAVVIVDSDGVVRAGNERVEEILGYTPMEVEGTHFETLLYDPHGEMRPARSSTATSSTPNPARWRRAWTCAHDARTGPKCP